jgi:hypothetical protein
LEIGVDQNVLETTLAKLRSSNLANNAPVINNTMPQLIPDKNPELIFPAISSRGSSRSLINFLCHVKKTYPDVFRSIRRFQHFLNDSCYCSADKMKYNPRYHKNGNQSMATFYFQQYKIESYRIKQQHTGSGGDPDDDFDPDDEDDFSPDDYKDLDGLKESDKKKLPEAALGYLFAEEEMRKIISWLDKFAALLKAQAYEMSTEVRNLFKENGELQNYYQYLRNKNKREKVCFCFGHLGVQSRSYLMLSCLLVRLLQNTPPFNLFVALDVQRHASAKFDELVNHKQLVEQQDAARSDSEKASALVKTAKETREAMANAKKAKGKTKAVATSEDVSKKRSRDNSTSEVPRKKKRAVTRPPRPIKGHYPPAGAPDAMNNDSDAQDEAATTKLKTSKKAAKKTSNNAKSMEDKTSSVDTDVAVKKKSAKNKSASNNADMVGDDALPSNNDVDAANVPDAPTKLQ